MALTLEAGTPVGKYVVKRKLAEGGMAEIYVAASRGPEGFEKEVVIKRVRSYLSTDPEFVQMFIAEARLASRLNHANIVQIFDFDKHEDTFYLAMEYVRGRSLWDVRRRARELMMPMRPTLVAHVGLEVARGLHYAHRLNDRGEPLNLVHRDVTPHNVLMSWEGAIKLTDFGIAKAGNKLTSPGMLKGKFAYMSPEQARGDAVDARTDVFALGIVLWEMLTGGRLFEGDSDVAVLRAVQQSAIAPPGRLNPDVPAELDGIVMKALAREVDARWQNAQELERALARYILGNAQSIEETDLGAYLRRLYADQLSPEGNEFTTAGIPNPLPPEPAPPRREPTAVMPGSRSGPRTLPAPLDAAPGGEGRGTASGKDAVPAPLPPNPDEDPHGATFVPNQRRTESLPSVRTGSKPGTPVPVTVPVEVVPEEMPAQASAGGASAPVAVEAAPVAPAVAEAAAEPEALPSAEAVVGQGRETVRFDQEELRAAIAARRAESARKEATQVSRPAPPAKRRTPATPRPSAAAPVARPVSAPVPKAKARVAPLAIVGAVVVVAAVAGVVWKSSSAGPEPIVDSALEDVVLPVVQDAGALPARDAGHDAGPPAMDADEDAGGEVEVAPDAGPPPPPPPIDLPATEKSQSGKGKVVIRATPWANVFVDGVQLFANGKPLDVEGTRELELPVGKRVIRLYHPQRTLERTVIIRSTGRQRINFDAFSGGP